MNSQEDKWFEAPTWNHEKVDAVCICFKRSNKGGKLVANKIYPAVVLFLDSLGFKNVSVKVNHFSVDFTQNYILVNFVEKEYGIIPKRLIWPIGVPQAVPSQIVPYMEQNRGMLIGRKFGL